MDDTPTISPSIPPPVQKKLPISQVDPKQQWPLDDIDSYCHQCRNKTFYAKMTCSGCQKKFCVRCYTFRYPEYDFDADNEEYTCPVCEGFCNCTACCRKRGERYVGVRTHNPAPTSSPLLRPRRALNPNPECVKLAVKTDLPPPTVIQTKAIPNGVTKPWGSLYNVTGEKIGTCFFDPSVQEDDLVVFAPATSAIMPTIPNVAQQRATTASTTELEVQVESKPKRKLKRRTFVDEPQSCWGHKNPKIELLKREPRSKRSYNPRPISYVGKKERLFYAIEEDVSSLTSMDESD